MKYLMILRHAEVAPAGGVSDIERTLTDEGRAHAEALGKQLRAWDIPIGRVVCSTAIRTRQTTEAVLAGRGIDAPATVSDQLYNASGETLLQYLQAMPDEDDRVLLVGHVPAVAELAGMLVTEHIDLAVLFRPATLLEVAMEDDSWSELDYGVGFLRMMIPPIQTAE